MIIVAAIMEPAGHTMVLLHQEGRIMEPIAHIPKVAGQTHHGAETIQVLNKGFRGEHQGRDRDTEDRAADQEAEDMENKIYLN